MMHRSIIRIFSFSFAWLSFTLGWSQEDLDALLEELAPLAPQEVIATFKSGKIINLQPKSSGSRRLELRISHGFGRLDGGPYELGDWMKAPSE